MAIPKSAGPHLPWGALDMSARMRDGYCCGAVRGCLAGWHHGHTEVSRAAPAMGSP